MEADDFDALPKWVTILLWVFDFGSFSTSEETEFLNDRTFSLIQLIAACGILKMDIVEFVCAVVLIAYFFGEFTIVADFFGELTIVADFFGEFTFVAGFLYEFPFNERNEVRTAGKLGLPEKPGE